MTRYAGADNIPLTIQRKGGTMYNETQAMPDEAKLQATIDDCPLFLTLTRGRARELLGDLNTILGHPLLGFDRNVLLCLRDIFSLALNGATGDDDE